MANENRASYFCIGLTVVAGVAAIVASLVYLGGMKDSGSEILVETYYDKPVGGLSVGSDVNLRGVKIGEVKEIGFIGTRYDVGGIDGSRIYILMSLDRQRLGFRNGEDEPGSETMLRNCVEKGLRVTVSSSGITGLSKMEVDYYADEPAPPPLPWTPRHMLVPPKMSLLDSFSESATKVMRQINQMDLNAFWSNIHASAESVSAMTLAAQHLIESYQPELERVVKNLEDATSSVREAMDAVRRDPSALIRGASPEPLPETDR